MGHRAMVTERLLLLGNLAFMYQPDQNCQSTLALSGKGPSWAALNFQELSGLPFRRLNEWQVLEPAKPRQPHAADLTYPLAPEGKRERRSKTHWISHACRSQEDRDN